MKSNKSNWLSQAFYRSESLSDLEKRKRDEFMDLVQHIIFLFQILESGMKIYLHKVSLKLEKFLWNEAKVSFNLHDEIDRKPLGGLLRLFRMCNLNIKLHRRIGKLVKVRNHYAHRGFLVYTGAEEGYFKKLDTLKKEIAKGQKLLPVLNKAISKLQKEIRRLPK